MAYTIPSIPDHLVVKKSDAIEKKEHAEAMKIFDRCQKKLAIGNFPFQEEIFPLDETHKHIISICDRLNTAGYKACAKKIEEREFCKRGPRYFTYNTCVIYVDKPRLL